jgi:hypothetical protein
MTKIYLVETQSIQKMTYIIESEKEISNATIQEKLMEGTLSEADQQWMGETIIGVREVSVEERDKKIKQLEESHKEEMEAIFGPNDTITGD